MGCAKIGVIMFDIQKGSNFPSTSSLSKTGVKAVGYTVAGIFISILIAVTESIWPAMIIGSIVCLLGIGSLSSRDKTDKKAGLIITIAGALTILSRTNIPVITSISGALLGISAFGLLAMGIWNGIKYIIGLKKRS